MNNIEQLFYKITESDIANLFINNQDILKIATYLDSCGAVCPPVTVGQTVWYIDGGYYNSAHKRPRAIIVTEINLKQSGNSLEWAFIANRTRYRFSSIGKKVFLTEGEAWESLRKKEEKKS